MSGISVTSVSLHTARELTTGEPEEMFQFEPSFGMHADIDALIREYPDADEMIVYVDGTVHIFD